MVAFSGDLRGAENDLPLYDFHTHSQLSDGALVPVELFRRAIVAGYAGMGLSDHSGPGGLERRVAEAAEDCRLAREEWGFPVYPGVELTHVPASAVAALAARARQAGARYVVVHGETPVEPTEPGTNLAAVSCPGVDLLAHPGLLTAEEAELAARNGVFLEVTAKPGHALGNGHVVAVARQAGAKLLLGSDTHDPAGLLSPAFARKVLLGAGLSEEELAGVLRDNAEEMLERIRRREESKDA
jgi:histidinol phosphatase-like PHP family hydrolase